MNRLNASFLLFMLMLLLNATAFGQGTVFTFQGRLTDSATAANGQFDFQFKLFDSGTVGAGTQLGMFSSSNVTVTAGIFNVQLDFGACASCFNGAPRFLEIAVKPTSGSTFTTLSQRQSITSTPYAIKSQNATAADGLSGTCVSCVTSNQIASIPQGSGNYIQNATAQQAGTNFNISGNGTAAGVLSGHTVNSDLGFTQGGSRAFTISQATFSVFAGFDNGNGSSCTLVGARAGQVNTGIANAFFGQASGISNTSGGFNAFYGDRSGLSNVTGRNLTMVGDRADVGADALSNATAIGSNAQVTQSNSLVLGSINGVNTATADTNVGIGTNAPLSRLDVVNTAGGTAIHFGDSTADSGGFLTSTSPSDATMSGGSKFDGTNWIAKSINASSIQHIAGVTRFFNDAAIPSGAIFTPTERMRISGNGNVGIGTASPAKHLHVTGAGDQEIMIESSDAGGIRWTLQSSSGSANGRFEIVDRTANASRFSILESGNVGIGTTAPADRLQVNGDIRVGTGTTGCVKDADGTVIAGNCSSDLRLKRGITPFPLLLNKLVQLQPVNFYWRADEFPDRKFGSSQSFGLIAQEVEKVLPELVTEDANGFKLVRYHKLPLLMLEAIKELKAENDTFKQQIDSLKKIVCLDHPGAEICK